MENPNTKYKKREKKEKTFTLQLARVEAAD